MAYAPFDLQGKVALITGGNSGIGLGMALALAQAGADVAIWGRNPVTLDEAGAALRECGVRVETAVVDVSDRAAVRAAVDNVVGSLGRIDAVFANAGIGRGAPFLELTEEIFRDVLATNLDGVVWTLQAVALHMVQRANDGDPGGSLVVTSSLSAREGSPRGQAYAATKGAVISVTNALAVEFARYGVRANSILPGWITTPLAAQGHASAIFQQKILPRIPNRRWGKPADFGGIAVYLASDASSYHSGDCITIDGGYSIF